MPGNRALFLYWHQICPSDIFSLAKSQLGEAAVVLGKIELEYPYNRQYPAAGRLLWDDPKPEHFIRTLVFLEKPLTGACHEDTPGLAPSRRDRQRQPPTAGCRNKA
jgi:hypothetical protein